MRFSDWSSDVCSSDLRAEDRVGAGREDLEIRGAAYRLAQLEAELAALALADPVLLHQTDLVGPLVELVEAVEQLLGEVGDLQEPLVELSPLDRRAGAPAPAVDHLLVGEHGHVDRIPVHLALLAIDETRLEEVEEQRLFVAVIIGLAGGEFPAPVEREAEALQLCPHGVDIGAGPGARSEEPTSELQSLMR